MPASPPPLAGIVVVDLARMLPGAVLARTLADLGARVIKIEEPGAGDPLRHAPPLVDGVGAGFAAHYRGAESVAADLRDADGAALLRRLVRHADVLTESFRPGALADWGLGAERLRALNPSLVVCSLSAYGQSGPHRDEPAHDLNLTAATGLLSLLGSPEVPRVQIVDVTTGLRASTAVLAALLRRARTGRGEELDISLADGAAAHLAWPLADLAAGGTGAWDSLLGGRCAAYRRYRCADGREIAVAAVEPKFWSAFVAGLGLPELAGSGHDAGPEGRTAARRVAEVIATRPLPHWLELARRERLPVSPVRTVDEARADDTLRLGERTGAAASAGDALAGSAAPRLGEHTSSVKRELGLDGDSHT